MAENDVVGMHVVGRYQDQNIVNNLTYKLTSQSSSEETVLDNLVELWDTAFTTPWTARHIDTYTLVGIKCFNLFGAAKVPGFKGLDEPGAVVGTEMPASLCRAITLYTASAKYRRRGRVQLSGGDTVMFNTDDGAVADAEIVALSALSTLLETALTGTGDTFTPCIPASGADPVELITYALARKTPALIRSRRVRQFLIG